MHSLQKQFHDFILAEELLQEDDYVLLAVSGGLDSMVMADLFIQSTWKLEVAHCNFNLRGKESDGDERFVRKWANEKGVPIYVKSFELGEGSTQVNARNARYQWFEELLLEKGFTKIVTAHHLNDSLETFLINFSRGTGLKGLSGIAASKDTIVRPLMFASRDRLEDYAKKCSLNWREDSSNEKTDYDRNFLRLEVIPKLKELNPSLIQTFRGTLERLQLAAELNKSQVDEVASKYLSVDGSSTELKLGWVKGVGTDLLILSEILAAYGFGYATSKQVYEAIGKSGKQFFSNNKVLSIDRDSLFIRLQEHPIDDILLIEGPGDFEFRQWSITISMVSKDEVDYSEPRSTVYLDTGKLSFPIRIRKWQDGDRFVPLGMDGSKKVSDYLIDKKVPLALKDEVLVLRSDEDIAWLVGHQISEKFKVTRKTEKVLKITCRNEVG